MPDIAMCRDERCLMKRFCYRYSATPDPMAQWYGDFHSDPAGHGCPMFWPMERDMVEEEDT